ncbi:OLC1v1008873C1 [Oldenlandia corymbosa var. corymbosa]|uniref:OLC1v1008873C1 n=1 Tax=Oldenlandia corymbosa var. corymbosa TaxID=529605 RepID=A0AAV1DMK3_OLDCO|nr:OLC1v1008873C1 [Oldenlandia corymbosa var. corymbosa]
MRAKRPLLEERKGTAKLDCRLKTLEGLNNSKHGEVLMMKTPVARHYKGGNCTLTWRALNLWLPFSVAKNTQKNSRRHQRSEPVFDPEIEATIRRTRAARRRQNRLQQDNQEGSSEMANQGGNPENNRNPGGDQQNRPERLLRDFFIPQQEEVQSPLVFPDPIDAARQLARQYDHQPFKMAIDPRANSKQPGMMELDPSTHLQAQMAVMMNEMTKLRSELSKSKAEVCVLCDASHSLDDCPSKMEAVHLSTGNAGDSTTSTIGEISNRPTGTMLHNKETIKGLLNPQDSTEKMLAQIAKQNAERPSGSLPSDTIVNPKGNDQEQAKAVTLRSGRQLNQPSEEVTPASDPAEQEQPAEKPGMEEIQFPAPIKEPQQQAPTPPYPGLSQMPPARRKAAARKNASNTRRRISSSSSSPSPERQRTPTPLASPAREPTPPPPPQPPRALQEQALNAITDEWEPRLAKEGTSWEMDDQENPLGFPANALQTPNLNLWHHFICCNLMPTSYTAKVTYEMALLLYAIVTDTPFDAVSVVREQLTRCITDPKVKSLYFPVMVTMLCKRAGVTFLHTDAESNLQQPLRMHKLDQKPPGASSAGQTTSTPTPTGQLRQRDFNKQTRFILDYVHQFQMRTEKFLQEMHKCIGCPENCPMPHDPPVHPLHGMPQ